MTNEEIEQQARTLLEMLGQEPHADALSDTAEAMRSLVSKAYDEAANLAGKHCAELLDGMSQAARDNDSRSHDRLNPAYGEARHIADDLRALADSISREGEK